MSQKKNKLKRKGKPKKVRNTNLEGINFSIGPYGSKELLRGFKNYSGR